MDSKTKITVLISTLLILCRYVFCNFDIPGETSPASVEIEAGDNVNISCRMNPRFFENSTSRDLYFMDASNHRRVAASDIIILNETTILYMLRNAQESKTIYRCMCGYNAIMETKVYVGHKPDPISDFTCRSYNYENMRCNFTKPHNHVLTQYSVSYHFNLNAYKYSPACDHSKSPLVTCKALDTYHSNENVFHYKIVATNSLGTYTQYFDIDSMSVTVLAPPGQNFTLKHVTTDSAIFTFRLKNPLRGLQWDLSLKPENLSEIVLSPLVHPVYISSNEFELNLLNLSYAYYEYQLNLRVRLSAVNEWSEPFTYWFRTLSRLPDRPPLIDVGAFETDPSETQIRLYWELLKPYEYNGFNFTYVVEQIGATDSIKPLLLETNSAVFPWKKEQQYTFSIRSQNHEGMSKAATFITIPAMVPESKVKMHTPPDVHNIYHESNGTFTLSWTRPKVVENLVDYTVYWCRKKILLLNSCEGSIHFQRVPRDIQHFTTDPQEHTLSLAVSANYEDFNTGMHWTECTMAEATDLVKMEPQVEATSATTIKIEWGSENMCPSIFEGYNLSYCAVDVINRDTINSDTYSCNQTEQYILINKTSKRWELQDLKPYTNYKVQIFMYSQRSHKFGKKSNPQIVQTLESAPSPPILLNVSEISNETATISWLPPSEPNGLIRYYTIVINNMSIKISANNDTAPHETVVYQLKGLSSSTAYNVYVLAQTLPNSVSKPSKDIGFVTLVGYPLKPGPVSLRNSKNDAEIEWAAPEGRVDFYEVAVTLMKGDELINRRISVVLDSRSCRFHIPKCFDHEYRTTVDVRSVNAADLRIDGHANNTSLLNDEDTEFYEGADELSCISVAGIDEKQNEILELYMDTSNYRLYKSDWVRGSILSCAASTLGTIMLYVLVTTFLIACISMLIYFMRQKYYKMANINCTLPAGLDAYMTKDSVSAVLSHNFITVIRGDVINNQSGISLEDKDDAVIQRNVHDFIVQNEEQRLVEATSQNSLLMNDHTQHLEFPQFRESPQNLTSNLLGDTNFDRGNHLNHLENRIEANDYLKANPANDADAGFRTANIDSPYVQATDILNQCPNGMMSMLPVNNSYIKPNALSNWQNINENQSNISNVSQGGYVSAESVAKILPKPIQNDTEFAYTNSENLLKSNQSTNNTQTIIEPPEQPFTSQEYVPASNLMACNSAGYTTIEQLSKLSAQTPAVNNWGTHNEALPTEVRPAISGYVTQRELNAFGQHNQQNFS